MGPASSNQDWAVAGIDLGTSNCCVSVFYNGKLEVVALDSLKTTPSVVTFYEDRIEYGYPAKENRSKSGAMPVYELKRLFGIPYEQYYNQFNFDVTTYQVVRHGNKSWLRLKEDYDNQWDIAPEHVYSMLLSYLFRRASDLYNGVIKGVVITVPANFTPIQIHETVLSAKMAGLNVLRIIYEPNAAALAYRRQNERIANKVLVCDVGGGTTDITLMKYSDNSFSIVRTSGNSHLGGCDFDRALAILFCNKARNLSSDFHVPPASNRFIRVLQRIEKYKLQFSKLKTPEETVEFSLDDLLDADTQDSVKISVRDFNNECMHLYDRIVKEATECVKSEDWLRSEVGTVLLVGGCSRLPLIKEKLENAFPNANVTALPDPDTIVSLGACEVAAREYCDANHIYMDPLPVQFVNMLAFDLKYYQDGKSHLIFSYGQINTEEMRILYSSLKVADNKLVVFMGDRSDGPCRDVELGYFAVPVWGMACEDSSDDSKEDKFPRTNSRKKEMTILIDSCVELQIAYRIGDSRGKAAFVYRDDLDRKDIQYITALNSIYSMMEIIQKRYSKNAQVMDLVQKWKEGEVSYRFKLHSILAERNAKAIKEGFRLSLVYCTLLLQSGVE